VTAEGPSQHNQLPFHKTQANKKSAVFHNISVWGTLLHVAHQHSQWLEIEAEKEILTWTHLHLPAHFLAS
jgi:hypothetical protein